jgi:hypothetical protein
MDYLIMREKDGQQEMVANATTVQVMFDYKTGASVSIPEYIRERLAAFDSGDKVLSI